MSDPDLKIATYWVQEIMGQQVVHAIDALRPASQVWTRKHVSTDPRDSCQLAIWRQSWCLPTSRSISALPDGDGSRYSFAVA